MGATHKVFEEKIGEKFLESRLVKNDFSVRKADTNHFSN